MKCQKCGHDNSEGAKFCNECGTTLQWSGTDPEPRPEHPSPRLTPEPERKHVTALFSDLTGYTSMTEKLDPEQVKEITGRIFTGVKEIVLKYEGFIERVMGDGVLAFFGIPRSHEDDPTRAIHAALEIHHLVQHLSPEYQARAGAPLTMHSGINTGLVVTADVDPTRGTHGIAGDAVNVASRLSGLAGPGEILVGEETARRTKGRFVFDDLGPKHVKGKAQPITVFRVVSVKASTPGSTTDRQVSSEMVGRDRELDLLEFQVMKAIHGEGSVVNVVGEAGIGKSRLIAELRKRDVMKKVTLLEGRAISIGRNLSFHPIIDLLKQWAGIAEDDSETARFDKLEHAIRAIHPEEADEILPFIATLMGMKLRGKHAERVKGIEGESLEKLIFKNVRELIIKGSERRPTLVVMEDLHWADESSLGLLESLYRLVENHRVLFINVFRPGYWQSEDRKVERISELFPHHYVEIAIQPLDKETSETLIGNMIDVKGLPYSLRIQIGERAGGNPFFIEEVVRSLIDEGAIVRTNGAFEVTDKIDSVVIPSTINDVIIARIDRLDEETRNLLKIASVIGRSFFDRILKAVATSIEDIDGRLGYLKDLQLIRDRMRMEEVEYLFKHALVQEAVYNSLLKSVRLELHERIGLMMEKLFKDRLSEFCETIAFHLKHGRSPRNAVKYLMLAGQRSINRFAVEEAHQYYGEAFVLLAEKPDTKDEVRLLIDLLIQWGTVIYYRGGFTDYEAILEAQEGRAVALNDKARLGMFYAWFGWTKFWRAKLYESQQLLDKALKIGEEIQDYQITGYASCWLAFVCPELGLLTEAEAMAEKALNASRMLPFDRYLCAKPLTALGHIYFIKGEGKKSLAAGSKLLELGKMHDNIRSMVMGHVVTGIGHYTAGDFASAIKSAQDAVNATSDPLYRHYALAVMSVSLAADQQFDLARDVAQKVVSFSREAGTEILGASCEFILALDLIANGFMKAGLEQVRTLSITFGARGRKHLHAVTEHVLGSVYLQIVQREVDLPLHVILKNIGFLVKNVPFAARRAEEHFNRAILVAQKEGLKGLLGQAYLDLGRLYQAKQKGDKARVCLSQAIGYFQECEADAFLNRAREVLESIR